MRTPIELAMSVLVGFGLLSLLFSCDRQSEREQELRRELAASRARVEEAKEQILREREMTQAEMARSREELEAEREKAQEAVRRLQRQLSLQEARTEGAEADFWVTAAICAGSTAATFILLHLLLRELTARKALARFVRILVRRNGR